MWSDHVMTWIAGVLPLLSFVLPFALYYWLRNAWLPTLAVGMGSLAVLAYGFSLKFWPWLLCYLLLCWLGCWAAGEVRSRRLGTEPAAKRQGYLD
ncbi:MAG: hypothetical protein K6T26_00295 [Alicyclobacillus sp.]|nr:hypothetical protein [Alicyclobacillus sp.]